MKSHQMHGELSKRQGHSAETPAGRLAASTMAINYPLLGPARGVGRKGLSRFYWLTCSWFLTSSHLKEAQRG